MLFAGTSISNGACVGIVNDIGMATQIGKIQAQIQAAEGEEDDSPLKKKLDEFGELLAKVCNHLLHQAFGRLQSLRQAGLK